MKRKPNTRYIRKNHRYWTEIIARDRETGEIFDFSYPFQNLSDAKKYLNYGNNPKLDYLTKKLYKNKDLLDKKYKVKNKKGERKNYV